jgi:hypothetical protein
MDLRKWRRKEGFGMATYEFSIGKREILCGSWRLPVGRGGNIKKEIAGFTQRAHRKIEAIGGNFATNFANRPRIR